MTSHEDRQRLWQDRLAAQQTSGMSVSAWCAQQGIKRTRFYLWRQRLQAGDPALAALQWVPVALESATAPCPPSAGTASGITLQVGAVTIAVAPDFQPAVLRAVLATLEARW